MNKIQQTYRKNPKRIFKKFSNKVGLNPIRHKDLIGDQKVYLAKHLNFAYLESLKNRIFYLRDNLCSLKDTKEYKIVFKHQGFETVCQIQLYK